MDEVFVVLENGWVSCGPDHPSVVVPDIVTVCYDAASADEFVATHDGDYVIEPHEVEHY